MDRAIEKIEQGLAKLSDNVPKYTNNDMVLAISITALVASAIPIVEQWITSYYNRKQLEKHKKKMRKRRELYEYIDTLVDERIAASIERRN